MLYLLLYPLVRTVVISFQDFRLRQLILGDAEFVGLDNYPTLLVRPALLEVVRRTFLFMAVNVVLIMVISTLVALMLERLGADRPDGGAQRAGARLGHAGGRGHDGLPVAVPLRVRDRQPGADRARLRRPSTRYPWFAHGTAAFAILVPLMVWQSVPFAAITLYSALTTVPAELYESARLDGASAARVFRSRHLPDPAADLHAGPLAGGDLDLQGLRADLGDDPRRPRRRHHHPARLRGPDGALQPAATTSAPRPP